MTASNFGIVCKCTEKKSLSSAVYKLLCQEISSNIPSIKYGIDNEKKAVKAYTSSTRNKVEGAGLCIHEQLPFLGCSPDGLDGSHGIIEVKCPYSIRDYHPRDAVKQKLLPYISNIDGDVDCGHIYFYQIQGTLEILDRDWCDLVIYSRKGILVKRIYRNKEFWEFMKPKLKHFYLNYLLPEIVQKTGIKTLMVNRDIKYFQIDIPLDCHQNGLSRNPGYYKKINKPYIISVYDQIKYVMKELRSDDFFTLDDGIWLSNFVIDISMHLINNEGYTDFQIFDSHTSMTIFADDHGTQNVITNIIFKKNKIAMPIHVNGNHWCFILIDLKKKHFSFLDPQGGTENQRKTYFNRFLKFMSQLPNNSLKSSEWNIISTDHVKQRDNYNCGIYVIHFFKAIIRNEPLISEFDPDGFRSELRYFLLEKSSNMRNRCLLCGSSDTLKRSIECRYCKRLFHFKCINDKLKNDFEFPFEYCDICIQNLSL